MSFCGVFVCGSGVIKYVEARREDTGIDEEPRGSGEHDVDVGDYRNKRNKRVKL